MASDSYIRFIDASGHAIAADGGTLFRVDDAAFGAQEAVRLATTPLTFTLGTGALSPLLDQMLAAGTTLAAVEIFRTGNTDTGVLRITDEQVLKDVGLSGDSIDVVAGTHAFTAVSAGLVESAATTPAGAVTLGWNTLTNTADDSLATGIDGARIDNRPDLAHDVAAAGEGAALDTYVRFTNASGASLPDGSRSAAAGWFEIGAADLGLSQTFDLARSTAGHVAFGPARLSLGDSRLDPLLLQALSAGTTLGVEIATYARGASPGSLRLVDDIRLGGATVTDATTGIDGGLATRTYDLSYRQEVIEHDTTDPRGRTTPSTSEGWDAAKNTALPLTSPLVPARAAQPDAPPTPLPQTLGATAYLRVAGAGGSPLVLDGGSLFEVHGVTLDNQAGKHGALPGTSLSFTLDSTGLSPTLDAMLVEGKTVAEIDLVQTTVDEGKTVVVATDRLLNVALDADTIDAASGAHVFSATGATHQQTAPATPAAPLPVASVQDLADQLQYFARIVDPKGEALLGDNRPGAAEWIALDSATFDLSRAPGAPGSTGGKVALGPVHIVLGDSRLDPVLLQAMGNGTPLGLEIAAYARGDGIVTPRLVDDDRFGGVLVASAATEGAPDQDDSTIRTYDLSYTREAIEHVATNADGTTTVTSESFDAATQTAPPADLLLPAQAARAHVIPADAPQVIDTASYVRLIDAAGRVVTADGGSLFAVGNLGLGARSDGRLSTGPLTFTLASGSLAPRLDQALASGTPFTAIEVFRTVTTKGTQHVVAEDVLKGIGLTADSIDPATGAHTFSAAYAGLVESAAPNSLSPVTLGWNTRTNLPDNSLATGIDGRPIDNSPDFATGVAATPARSLDLYLRLSDARGASLSGAGQSPDSGWLRLDDASLALSNAFDPRAAAFGKVSFDPAQLVLDAGALDPVLLQDIARATPLGAEIAAYAPAGPGAPSRLVDDIRLGGATATATAAQPDGTRTYDLTYTREVVEHYATDPSGHATLAASEGWNATTNSALASNSSLVPAQGARPDAPPITNGATPSAPAFSPSALAFGPLASGSTIDPFAGTTLSDPGTSAVETLTVVASSGTFSGAGFAQTSTGTFVATGSVAQIDADLAGAHFTDTAYSMQVRGFKADVISATDTGSVGGLASAPATLAIEVLFMTEMVAPCFASGTLIRTKVGDVPVEALRVGDLVRTASGRLRPVRWLGHRRVDCQRHPQPERVRPVRVRAHAFGDGLPARDLVLSPEHALFLDGHLVPVHALADGVSVAQEAWERVTYHHVELDGHDVLLAEGLPAESYLDTGNRTQFANATVVALHSDFGPGEEATEPCAPLLLAGARLQALRAELAARVAPSDIHRLA